MNLEAIKAIYTVEMARTFRTPLMAVMRGPMAEPKTTKYSAVEITGATIDCSGVRKVRAISTV